MAFVVSELKDPSSARPGLDALCRLNSQHVNLDTEAQLAHARFWVAHTGDVAQPVAYALVWLLGTEAEIVDLATDPSWRRQGAAGFLLHQLERRYRTLDVEALYLEVRASNHAAIALYTQHGFEQTRVRLRYYADGEDAWEMRKALA